MNQGADLPMACFGDAAGVKGADEARSLSTMAAARQKEMKDSITVVATTTLTVAARCLGLSRKISLLTHTAVTLKFACEVS